MGIRVNRGSGGGESSLPAPYSMQVSSSGKLQLRKNGKVIQEQDEAGAWISNSVTTGTGSFHLGGLHSNGSAGENVLWLNNTADTAYFPPWQGVSIDGSSVLTPTVRTFGNLTTSEPIGAVGGNDVNYNDVITTSVNVVFFKIEIMPSENYQGVLHWHVSNDNGVEIASFLRNVVLQRDTLFVLTLEYPLFAKSGQSFVVSARKGLDGQLLKVKSGTSDTNKPYRKTHYRTFTDVAIPAVGATFGDVKDGIQTEDHNGWVMLNGRSKSSLTPTQQAVATSLGIGSAIPDTRNRVRVGAGLTYALMTFGGTDMLVQSNLPNVTLSGVTAVNNVGHTHEIDPPNTTSTIESAGHTPVINPPATTSSDQSQGHTHQADPPSVRTSSYSHSHNVYANGGWDGTSWVGGSDRGSYGAYSGWLSSDTHDHSVDIPAFNAGGNSVGHTHTLDISPFDSAGVSANHTHNINIPAFTSGVNSSTHTHTYSVSLNGAVTQTSYMPRYMAFNTFMFLGA